MTISPSQAAEAAVVEALAQPFVKTPTVVDTLLDSATVVQQWETRVEQIETALLRNTHDRDIVEALAPIRDRRVDTLDAARTGLSQSIRAYSDATSGVPARPAVDPLDRLLVAVLPDNSLGSITTLLREMLSKGITSESIKYALGQADGTH